MNNWFMLIVGAVELCAGVQCILNKQYWLGLTWVLYAGSCACLYMNGRT